MHLQVSVPTQGRTGYLKVHRAIQRKGAEIWCAKLNKKIELASKKVSETTNSNVAYNL